MSQSLTNPYDVYISDDDKIDLDFINSDYSPTVYTTTSGSSYASHTITTGTAGFNGTYTISGIDYSNPGLKVAGDADFEGDVTIKGKSLVKTLEGIEQRLAILTPDPAKLEKYAALREAYEHYKMLEALIGDE
jgi:hypothetical protein